MPVALISTSTSPARGPSRASSSMVSGWPACQATAARVFMDGRMFGEEGEASQLSQGRGACFSAQQGLQRDLGIRGLVPYRRHALVHQLAAPHVIDWGIDGFHGGQHIGVVVE